MRRELFFATALLGASACARLPAEDNGGSSANAPTWGQDDDDGGDDGGYEPCEETWIDWVGSDQPHVGDEWTVWLYCDGALLTGPTVIRFDPLDFATVDENIVTFTEAGPGWMRVQTGSEWAELEFEVLD